MWGVTPHHLFAILWPPPRHCTWPRCPVLGGPGIISVLPPPKGGLTGLRGMTGVLGGGYLGRLLPPFPGTQETGCPPPWDPTALGPPLRGTQASGTPPHPGTPVSGPPTQGPRCPGPPHPMTQACGTPHPRTQAPGHPQSRVPPPSPTSHSHLSSLTGGGPRSCGAPQSPSHHGDIAAPHRTPPTPPARAPQGLRTPPASSPTVPSHPGPCGPAVASPTVAAPLGT